MHESDKKVQDLTYPTTETVSGQPVTRYPILFSGRAGEYFRIWIVNIFLTLITAGIYSAWAKVRTRRYFYAHTTINGYSFDYLANPVNILKGHLIIGMLFAAYMICSSFFPEWGVAFVVLFYSLFPYLIYKSIRFYAHNSAYRNIRFFFDGTVWESYQLFLLLPMLIPLTLGVYFPYWEYLKKKWFFENSAFGTTFNEFKGMAKPFYRIYLFGFLQYLIMVVLFLGVIALILFVTGMLNLKPGPAALEVFQKGLLMGIGLYVVMIVSIAMVQQYVFSRITNYCWQQSRIGSVRVISALKARKLFWIRITNIMAILFSIGILIPWAKIRRTTYILNCMSIESDQALDGFTSGHNADVTAVGDAAADFFDFEVGL